MPTPQFGATGHTPQPRLRLRPLHAAWLWITDLFMTHAIRFNVHLTSVLYSTFWLMSIRLHSTNGSAPSGKARRSSLSCASVLFFCLWIGLNQFLARAQTSSSTV